MIPNDTQSYGARLLPGLQSVVQRPWYNYFLSVMIGLVIGVGFIVPQLWWACLVGLGWWCYMLQRTDTWYQAAALGLICWWVLACLSLLWMWDVYPLDWLEAGLRPQQAAIVGVYWVTSALWLGLGGVLAATGFWYIMRHGALWAWLCLPVVWLLAEVAGSLFFSIFTLGDGGYMLPYFSFAYIGFIVASHPWLFHASAWGGVYALTVVASSLACLTYVLWHRRYVPRYIIFGLLAVLVASGYVPQYTSTAAEQGYRVAVIETYFDASFRIQDNFIAQQYDLVSDAIDVAQSYQPDYILLPEDVGFTQEQKRRSDVALSLRSRFGTSSVQLIDAGQREWGEDKIMRGYIYDNSTLQITVADKQYLVPQGEFMPYLHSRTARLLGYGDSVERLAERIRYVPGPEISQAHFSDTIPMLLFCSEGISPTMVRTRLAERSSVPFVAHPISHAWFHNSTKLSHQLDTMLRVQARWNNVHIVSAANQSTSRHYRSDGSIGQPNYRDSSSSEQWDVLFFDI